MLATAELPKLFAIAIIRSARRCIAQGGSVPCKEDRIEDRSGAAHAEEKAERKTDQHRECKVVEHRPRVSAAARRSASKLLCSHFAAL